MSAVHIGYDTRVLVDVSIALTYFDRAWALERLEQHDVLGEAGFELLVFHRIAAILDDEGLAVEALKIGQRLH